MRAVVYDAPRQFTVREVERPGLGDREVRLRVLASGICGTDIHTHNGGFDVTFPFTPGHEIVGEVIETGELATLEVGMRVAVDNSFVCEECWFCRHGKPWLCNGTPRARLFPGGVSEELVIPEDHCHQVDDLAIDDAVLAEPTACVVHGLDVLDVGVGDEVLIVGAGPTGQILSQLIARGRASRVTVAAPTRFKLDIARANGADAVVMLDRSNPASLLDTRAESSGAFDIVIDATGSPSMLEQAVPLVRDGGTLFVYGMAAQDALISLRPYEIFRRELAVRGSLAQHNCVGRAIDLIRGGKVTSNGLITHRFRMDDYASALATLSDSACLKAVVNP